MSSRGVEYEKFNIPKPRNVSLAEIGSLKGACADFTKVTTEIEGGKCDFHEPTQDYKFTLPEDFTYELIQKTSTTIYHDITKYKSYEPTQELTTIPEAFPCEEELPPLTKDN